MAPLRHKTGINRCRRHGWSERGLFGYGRIASLVLPADVSWSEGGVTAELGAIEGPSPMDPAVVTQVAEALKSGRKAVIILGNPAVVEELHPLLKGIADQTGAELMGSSTISNMPKGKGGWCCRSCLMW